MTSLMQFDGQTSRTKGVRLEFYPVQPNPRYPDSATLGIETDTYVCHFCGREHSRIYTAWRKPVGMFGHWVVFNFNREKIVPDLSLPFSVFRLPRDAKPLSQIESSRIWHSPY